MAQTHSNSITNFTINHTPQFTYVNSAPPHQKHKKQVIFLEDDDAIVQSNNKVQNKQFLNILQNIIKKALSNQSINQSFEILLLQAKSLPLKMLWNMEYTNRLSYVSHLIIKKNRQTNLNWSPHPIEYKQKIIQKLQSQIQRVQKLYVMGFQNFQFLNEMENQINSLDTMLLNSTAHNAKQKNSIIEVKGDSSDMENINQDNNLNVNGMNNTNLANLNMTMMNNFNLAANMYLNMGNMQMNGNINGITPHNNNNFFASNYMNSMYMNNPNSQFMNNMVNQQNNFDAHYPKKQQGFQIMLGNPISQNVTASKNNHKNINAAQNGHKKH